MKVEAIDYGDRRVYAVSAFNRGVASWLERLPTVWVEGEVTGLRRQPGWQSVFLTLKDPEDGACLAVTMPRGQFDGLRLELSDGERVHVYGRPVLFEPKGEFRLRALTVERFGMGAHLAALERLKRRLAAEGLFDDARKRRLPQIPRRIGLVTGNDAAAKRDVVVAISTRFPPARIVVAETYVQGPRAPAAIVQALHDVCEQPDVDVVVIARGGGSFDDLLPFSDERVVRAVGTCAVPVVSAVGHEQDMPLCDLAADVRASTPTAAARLVVPDAAELAEGLRGARRGLERGTRRLLERKRREQDALAARLRRAPMLAVDRDRRLVVALELRLRRAPVVLLERRRARLVAAAGRLGALSPQATLERGYAIVHGTTGVVRDASAVEPGERVDVQVARGRFGARVEDTHE